MSGHTSDFTLERPPLVAVVVKVQFDPVLKMGQYVPDMQECLRRADFPVFEHRVIKQFRLVRAGAPETRDQPIWRFANASNTRIFALGVDSLSLLTSDYSTFIDFSNILREGLRALFEIVAPPTVVTLGYRAVNIIEPTDENSSESVLRQLHPGLRGVPVERLDTAHFHHHYRYWSATSLGNLVIQGRLAHGNSCLPQDLLEGSLALRKFDQHPYVYALDLDHSTGKKRKNVPFKPEQLIDELDRLHQLVNGGFVSCVTEQALNLWGYSHKTQVGVSAVVV